MASLPPCWLIAPPRPQKLDGVWSTPYGVRDSFLGDGADCDTRLGAEDAPIMEHTVILFKVQCQEPKKGEYERRKTKTQCPSNRAPVWILISFSPYGVLHTPYCHPGKYSVAPYPSRYFGATAHILKIRCPDLGGLHHHALPPSIPPVRPSNWLPPCSPCAKRCRADH